MKEKKKMKYKKSDLALFKKLIKKKLKKLNKEQEQLGALYRDQKNYVASSNAGTDGNSQYMSAKYMLKKLRRRTNDKIKALHNALKRIERGTYGVCEITGKLIGKKRLKAKLTAKKSIS